MQIKGAMLLDLPTGCGHHTTGDTTTSNTSASSGAPNGQGPRASRGWGEQHARAHTQTHTDTHTHRHTDTHTHTHKPSPPDANKSFGNAALAPCAVNRNFGVTQWFVSTQEPRAVGGGGGGGLIRRLDWRRGGGET